MGKVNTCVYVHCICIYEKRDKRRNGGASFIFDRRIRLDLFRRELEVRAVGRKDDADVECAQIFVFPDG